MVDLRVRELPDPVIIEDYDPRWPQLFEMLRARIAAVLNELAISIEHVGSTAVPGLAAKPPSNFLIPLHTVTRKGESMRRLLPTVLLFILALPAFSQDKQSTENPFSNVNKHSYERTKGILLRSAEKMPEENYSFKPADSVRSYGQIVGHLADAQYLFCSMASGDKNPGLNIEKTKTAKADLIAALKDGFSYCDKVYDSMTDAASLQTVKFFGNDAPKFLPLNVNVSHNMEHYGNLVTYMRMKGIVPPTSEQQGATPPQKQDKSDTQPKK